MIIILFPCSISHSYLFLGAKHIHILFDNSSKRPEVVFFTLWGKQALESWLWLERKIGVKTPPLPTCNPVRQCYTAESHLGQDSLPLNSVFPFQFLCIIYFKNSCNSYFAGGWVLIWYTHDWPQNLGDSLHSDEAGLLIQILLRISRWQAGRLIWAQDAMRLTIQVPVSENDLGSWIHFYLKKNFFSCDYSAYNFIMVLSGCNLTSFLFLMDLLSKHSLSLTSGITGKKINPFSWVLMAEWNAVWRRPLVSVQNEKLSLDKCSEG